MSRIAVQIALSFLALTAVMVGVGAIAAMLLSGLGDEIGRTLDENVQSVVAAERMARALDSQEAARARGDSVAFASGGAAFRSALARAEAAAVLPEEPALIDSIRAAHVAYAREWGADRSAEVGVARLVTLGGRLLTLNEQAAQARARAAAAAATTARRSLLLALACALVASALAGVYFTRRISLPIRDLTAGVVEIGRGNFGQRVDGAAGGEVGTLASAFNEMAARLEAYEALNVRAILREKRTAESLVAAIPSPVVVTEGPEARVRLVNAAAAALLGADARGRPIDEAAPALARLSAAQGPERLLDLDADGAARTYRLSQTDVDVPADPDTPDGPGDRLAVLVLDDVTPFRALDAARREFLADVSHELRTPLTSLHVAADLLLRGAAGPLNDDQRELAGIVQGDAERLKALTARLLDLARVEMGGRPAGPVALGPLARIAADGVRLLASERGVDLVVEGSATAEGDPDALAMAVSNLVANAVRHARSRVLVRVVGADADALLSVEDDGPGLPPGTQDRVFHPLVQLGDSTGSAGLGLAIVRRVAEAHGGRAWAEPGPGGRFFLSVPAAGAPGKATA